MAETMCSVLALLPLVLAGGIIIITPTLGTTVAGSRGLIP